MNDSSSSNCPDCGAALSSDFPQFLCANCLMRQALASRTLIEGERSFDSSPPMSPDEIAGKFPQFEILECLGRGGMAVVYKARQKSLNRLVAIKILAPERVHEPRFAERFAREAELLAKLSHPQIVTIHDFGETDGLFYLVMEFVDGVNLRDLLRDGKLAPEQALAIVPPICEALQYAHAKGIVHRDIKPENLLLDRDGRIKIADFGISALIGSGNEPSGTPPYMAPEQEKFSANIDHRADIYALGVVLYEMLTGERPAKNLIAPSAKADVGVKIDEMVLRALQPEPDRRFQTAEDFKTVVETLRSAPPALPVAAKTGLWRNYWWVPLVMMPLGLVFGLFAGSLLSYAMPKRYESSAVIEVQKARGGQLIGSLLPLPALENIAERLDLNRKWGIENSAQRLKTMIVLGGLRGAPDLISIRVSSTNRQEPREIADATVAEIQRGTAEDRRIIVHESAVDPMTPVSPNVPLVLLVSAAAGLVFSLALAVLLMAFLNRRRNQQKGIPPKLAWSVAIVCFLTFAGTWIFRELKPPTEPLSSLSPRFVSPEIGRIEFKYRIEGEENGGGTGATFGVKEGGDTQWVPVGGQQFNFAGKSVRVRSRAVCETFPEGNRILATAAISDDGITWRGEDVLINPVSGASEKTILLPHDVRVRIQWTPSPSVKVE